MKFENGVTADYVSSSISAVNRPKWRILGTKSAVQQIMKFAWYPILRDYAIKGLLRLLTPEKHGRVITGI